MGRSPSKAVPLVPWNCLVAGLGRSSPLVNHLYCKCLRFTSAVAQVPSVPLIVAGRSLKVRCTLNFRKLSPIKRKPFAAGKGHKGPKRQKRRHLRDASRFYWPRRLKGRGRSGAEPQQSRPFSPLEMPEGRSGRSSPLVNHLTANACALLLPSLKSLLSLRLSPGVRVRQAYV